VFLGTHAPRLDEKGRLILPAKYREELAGGVVITKGQERCLYVFPQEEFTRITEALRTAPVTAKAVRDYSRVFFASASDEVPDKQGRITVPGWRSGTRKRGTPTSPRRRTRSPRPLRRCSRESCSSHAPAPIRRFLLASLPRCQPAARADGAGGG